jgi:hypothetical protein
MRKQGGQWKGSWGDIDWQATVHTYSHREDIVDTVSQSVTRNQIYTPFFPTRWREGSLGLDTGNSV